MDLLSGELVLYVELARKGGKGMRGEGREWDEGGREGKG